MWKLLRMFGVFLCTLSDITLVLLLYIYFKRTRYQIVDDFFKFSFSTSTFDIVLLAILRFSILFGILIGLACNQSSGWYKVIKYKSLSLYYVCGQATYIIVKILFYMHNDDVALKHFWILSALTLMSCLTFSCCWNIFLKVNTRKSCSINESGSSQNYLSESTDQTELTSKQIIYGLLRTAKPDWFYFFLALIFLIVGAVCQTVVPYFTGTIVNNIVVERNVRKFHTALMSLTSVSLLSVIAAGLRAGTFRYVLGRYKLRLQHLLFSNLMQMEVGFYDSHKSGELMSHLSTDSAKIADGISINLNIFLRCCVKIVIVLFFMFKLSWQLSTIVLVALAITTVASDHFGVKLKDLSGDVQKSLAFANSSALDALTSIKTVRTFAAEKLESERYDKLLDMTRGIMKVQSFIAAAYRWSVESTNLVMTIIILYYGGHLVLNNKITGGVLISFILYVFELTYAVLDIGTVYTGLMDVVGASKNIFLYIDRKARIETNGTFIPSSKSINGHIQFKDVSFAYPTREDITVLNDVSFTASKGELVALVGPSGGGKSSLINLLQHFYEPKDGQILIDGVPVKDYDHNFLHEKMSLVQQEPILFARTISENIKYGLKSEIADFDIKFSAELANAHSFISSMPNEYDTQTGEKGIQLSGGQKQRIAIARALIRNPAILLLDEATSALDSESEHLVQQAINKNLVGRTVIVIAHRLSTVEKADKILVIDQGKIVEEGRHQDLLKNEGLYAALVKKQLLGNDDGGCHNGSWKRRKTIL